MQFIHTAPTDTKSILLPHSWPHSMSNFVPRHCEDKSSVFRAPSIVWGYGHPLLTGMDMQWGKWKCGLQMIKMESSDHSCILLWNPVRKVFLGLWISRHNMAELWNSLRWLQLHPRRSSTQFTKIRCHGILGPQVFRPTPRWTTISARLCRRSVYQYKLYS